MCILYCVWLCTWKPKQREICGAKLELWLAINQQEKARQRQTTYNEQHGQYLSANAIVLRTYFIFTVALCVDNTYYSVFLCVFWFHIIFFCFFSFASSFALARSLSRSFCVCRFAFSFGFSFDCMCVSRRQTPPNRWNRNNCFEFARLPIWMNKWMILITIWWPHEGGPMYRHCSMLALYSLCAYICQQFVCIVRSYHSGTTLNVNRFFDCCIFYLADGVLWMCTQFFAEWIAVKSSNSNQW